MILPIGTWIVREACRQARAWVDAGLPATTVAVNISAGQFENQDFARDLRAILAQTGLDPRSLELEVSEGIVLKHAEKAAAMPRAVGKCGVRAVVDEFGTGYSSFSCFQKRAADALKIDQSFVSQLTDAGQGDSIVTAMTGMARNLELRVAAEGVETPAKLALLQAHQCDEAQRVYFSPPLIAQEFADLLSAASAKPGFATSGAGVIPWPCALDADNQPSLPQEIE